MIISWNWKRYIFIYQNIIVLKSTERYWIQNLKIYMATWKVYTSNFFISLPDYIMWHKCLLFTVYTSMPCHGLTLSRYIFPFFALDLAVWLALAFWVWTGRGWVNGGALMLFLPVPMSEITPWVAVVKAAKRPQCWPGCGTKSWSKDCLNQLNPNEPRHGNTCTLCTKKIPRLHVRM